MVPGVLDARSAPGGVAEPHVPGVVLINAAATLRRLLASVS